MSSEQQSNRVRFRSRRSGEGPEGLFICPAINGMEIEIMRI